MLTLHERWDVDLNRPLGEGGFGTVYRAREPETGFDVAAKRVSLRGKAEVDAFAAEVALLRSVGGHVSIIELLDSAVLDGEGWFILELCRGGELFDRLTDSGVLSERAAWPFFTALVSAIAHCHARGVVHRDVKLENVMLCDDDPRAVKLIDFGLAVQLPRADDGLVAAGTRLFDPAGTLSYRAPELTRAGYLGPPVDVWSLGIVLFSLVAGFFPLSEARLPTPGGGGDWRFTKLAQSEASGVGACDAVFGMYSRSCRFSRQLRALLDGMLTIDPSKRLTIAQVGAAAWVGCEPAAPADGALHRGTDGGDDEGVQGGDDDEGAYYRCGGDAGDGAADVDAALPEGIVPLCRQRAARAWDE